SVSRSPCPSTSSSSSSTTLADQHRRPPAVRTVDRDDTRSRPGRRARAAPHSAVPCTSLSVCGACSTDHPGEEMSWCVRLASTVTRVVWSGAGAFRASPLRYPRDRPLSPIRHTRLKVSSTQRYAHVEPCFADVYVFTPGWGRARPRTGVRGSRRAAPVAGREVGLRERTGPGSCVPCGSAPRVIGNTLIKWTRERHTGWSAIMFPLDKLLDT